MVDRSLCYYWEITVTIELGIPVRRPDAKTIPIVGIPDYYYYSYSWKFNNRRLMRPFDPNCRATWAPTPRKGAIDPNYTPKLPL